MEPGTCCRDRGQQERENALIRRVNTLEKKYADGKAEREELEKAVREEQRYTASEPLRLFLDDVTPEKLAAQMAANDGVCVLSSRQKAGSVRSWQGVTAAMRILMWRSRRTPPIPSVLTAPQSRASPLTNLP